MTVTFIRDAKYLMLAQMFFLLFLTVIIVYISFFTGRLLYCNFPLRCSFHFADQRPNA